MPKIALTGASGFLGRHVASELIRRGWTVRGCVRGDAGCLPNGVEQVQMGDLCSVTSWDAALEGMDVVVHAAGLAHVPSHEAKMTSADFRRVNVDATIALARAAVEFGVRRLVFISSIGVNGRSSHCKPFSEDDPAHPHGGYAESKWLAEQQLERWAHDTGLQLVIVRPTLIAGRGAPGNLHRLAQLVRARMPLPFGAIRSRRSLVSAEGVAELIGICCEHDAAAGQLFLAAEGWPLSTAEVVRLIAQGAGKKARLPYVPAGLLQSLLVLAGRSTDAQRLYEPLEVSAEKARRVLGWRGDSERLLRSVREVGGSGKL